VISLKKVIAAFQAAHLGWRLLLNSALVMLAVLVLVTGLTAAAEPAQAFVPVDRADFARSGIEGSDSASLFKLLHLSHFSKEATPTHVLTAKSFILHIDEYEELDDPGILERSEAQAKSLINPEEYITPVVIESTVYPAVGPHRITLGFDEELFSQEPTPTPRKDIYALVVDDDTLVDQGVVFFAEDFEIAFSERSELTTQTVIEYASARAFYLDTGDDISCEILIDEQELADFIQSDCLEPFDLMISVPATVPADMVAAIPAGIALLDKLNAVHAAYLLEEESEGELGEGAANEAYPEEPALVEAPLVSVTIQITTVDDRPEWQLPPRPPYPPQIPQPPRPPQAPPLIPPQTPPSPPTGGDSEGGADTGGNNGGGSNTGGTNNDSSGGAGSGNNAGNNNAGTENGASNDPGPAVLGSAPGTGQTTRPSPRPRTASNQRPATNTTTATPATESADEGEDATSDAAVPEQDIVQATPGTAEVTPVPVAVDSIASEGEAAEDSNFFLILGITIALIALGAAGYLCYQRFFKKEPEVAT